MYSPVSRPDLIGVETPFHPITTWDCKYLPLKHTHGQIAPLQEKTHPSLRISFHLPTSVTEQGLLSKSVTKFFHSQTSLLCSLKWPISATRYRYALICGDLEAESHHQVYSHFFIQQFHPPSKSQQNIWPQIVTNKKSAQSYHLRRARIAVWRLASEISLAIFWPPDDDVVWPQAVIQAAGQQKKHKKYQVEAQISFDSSLSFHLIR